MTQTSQTTDLFTLIGMMATIAGILLCLFFLFTPATFGAMEATGVTEHSPDLQISMRWIQPILGQAIVEDALIRQRSQEQPALAMLDGPEKPGFGSIQWMVGRVIVELNRTRIVSGLSEEARHQDEQRIITIARHAGQQFLKGAPGSSS